MTTLKGTLKSLAAIAVGVTLALGVSVPASATTVSAAPAVVKSAACVKATNNLTVAKKSLEKARKSGNTKTIKVATARYNKAKKVRTNACKPAATGFSKPYGNANTFSGYPYDPRPVNWVKPADGSGLPGSNLTQVTNANNCSVAVHKVEFETSARTGQVKVIAHYTNNAPMYVKASIVVDVVDNNGNPVYNTKKIVDGGLQSGSWPMLEAVVADGSSLIGTTYEGDWVGGPSVTAKNGTQVAKVTVTCEGYAAWGGDEFKPWETLTPSIVASIVKETT